MKKVRKLADAVTEAVGSELLADQINEKIDSAMRDKIQNMPENTNEEIAKKRTVEAMHEAAGAGYWHVGVKHEFDDDTDLKSKTTNKSLTWYDIHKARGNYFPLMFEGLKWAIQTAAFSLGLGTSYMNNTKNNALRKHYSDWQKVHKDIRNDKPLRRQCQELLERCNQAGQAAQDQVAAATRTQRKSNTDAIRKRVAQGQGAYRKGPQPQ